MENMNKPLLSVVVPAYNAFAYLPRLIDSLVNQTWTDFEVILVDDGSSDNTYALCCTYALKDARIKVYTKKNGGPSEARNWGIEKACGKWLLFIDADDYVSADYFESFFKYNKFDIKTQVIQGYEKFDDSNNVIESFQYCMKPVEVLCNSYSPFLSENKLLHRWEILGKIYATDIVKSNHLQFDNTIHIYEDGIFWHQYLLLIDKLIFVPEQGYHYFRPSTHTTISTSHTIDTNEIIAIAKHYKTLSYQLIEHFCLDEYKDDIVRLYINRCIIAVLKVKVGSVEMMKSCLEILPNSLKYYQFHNIKEFLLGIYIYCCRYIYSIFVFLYK